MEYDFPPDRIGDSAEVDGIGVGVGYGVVMGVFLQHDDSVFVKVGTESGFITEQVFTGDAVYGFVPVFQSDIVIVIAFQPLDPVTAAVFVCLFF